MSPSEAFSVADLGRIRTALKWAQDVLWERGPDTGGSSDERTLAALLLIFRDPELVNASEASRHPLAAAVRDIRAILGRKDRDPLLSCRQIIDALCHESAIDAPWLYAALAKRNDRFLFERARPGGPSDLQAAWPVLVNLTRYREKDRGARKSVISISTERTSTDDFCC